MPEPRPDETQDEFLQRCMSDDEANEDFPDPAQRYAFCMSQWERRSMTVAEMIAAIRKRAGDKFGYGITTADRYVREALKCVNATESLQVEDPETLVKEAEQRLVCCQDGEPVEYESSVAGIKRILPKDVEVPANTLMIVKHKLTTPREDRDRDILRTEGAKVDPRMPMLWQHMHMLPIGKRVATLTHTAKVLRLASVLLDLNELTSDAAKLIEADVLRFSHGFRTLKYKEREDKDGNWIGGFDIEEFEIMEASLVSVPSNVDAEIELYSRDKLKSDLFKSHARALADARPLKVGGVEVPEPTKSAEPQEPDPEPSEPPSAEPRAQRAAPCPTSGGGDDKGGRAISAANLKVLKEVRDDLAELVEDDEMKRGHKALLSRCHGQLAELIERAEADDGDDSQRAAPVATLSPPAPSPREAAVIVCSCCDAALKRQVLQSLEAQRAVEQLDKRGQLYRNAVGCS